MTPRSLAAGLLGLVALVGLGLWLGAPGGPEPVRPAELESLDPLVRERLEQELANVERQRGSPEARLRLGMAYEANGLFGEAARTYRQALELAPGNARALFRLAATEERMGDLARAAGTLAAAAEAEPGYAPSWWRLAWWRLDLGETEDAAAALARAHALTPEDPAVRLGEVRLALARHAPDEAIARLEQGGFLADAGMPYARQLLALALRQQGDLAGAERASTEAGGEKPRLDDPWTREMRQWETGYAVQRLRAGRDLTARRLPEARQRLEEILAHDPDDPQSLNLLGACLLEQGDPRGALVPLERALVLTPEAFEPTINQARALVRAGNATPEALAAAHERLARALRTRGEDANAWRVLAALADARHRPQDVLAALERALALDPDAPDLALKAAYAALATGDPDAALARFRALQVARPDELEAGYGEVAALLAAQRNEEAEQALARLAAHPGADPRRLEALRAKLAATR